MQFPTINHINDLLPYVENNSQFRVQVQPNGTTIVCYLLQDEDTFSGEHEEWFKECRGITFHADGSVAARTLHKFHNVGESEDLMPDKIQWDQVARVFDKMDGSMIVPVLLPSGEIICKTKKTFTSAEAVAATEFLNKNAELINWCDVIITQGLTPTFEWTSPRFPIVLTYTKDELTLLHIRDNKTGKYVGHSESLFQLCPTPKVADLSPNNNKGAYAKNLLEEAKTASGIEGWVIQLTNGEMYKIKTEWYVKLHRFVVFLKVDTVVAAILEDRIDDILSLLMLSKKHDDVNRIKKIQAQVFSELAQIENEVLSIVALEKSANSTVKDVALKYKDHEFFSLIITSFKGKTADFKLWVKKNRSSQYKAISLSAISL